MRRGRRGENRRLAGAAGQALLVEVGKTPTMILKLSIMAIMQEESAARAAISAIFGSIVKTMEDALRYHMKVEVEI